MKRKTIVLLITMLLSFSLIWLTACGNGGSGSNSSDNDDATVEEDEEMVEGTDEDMLDDTADELDEEEPADVEGVEEEGTEEETVAGVPPTDVLGESTDTTYQNDYLGIRFTVPSDNWYIANEAERGQVMGLTTELLSQDEAMAQALENAGYAMDLYALDVSQATDNPDSANITIQDIGKVYGAMFSEKDLADASIDQIVRALESQGWTVETDSGEIDFCGSSTYSVSLKSTMEDQTLYQKQVYVKKESYIAAITVGSFGDDRTDEYLACFSAL